MSVWRASSRVLVLFAALLALFGPPRAWADGGSTTTTTTITTTTVQVASEAPAPAAAGPGGSSQGLWWLLGFGGLQLVGLVVITRRARAGLSTSATRS